MTVNTIQEVEQKEKKQKMREIKGKRIAIDKRELALNPISNIQNEKYE